MPLYDFACAECGTTFEKKISYQGSLNDVSCPQGHHAVRRVYRPPQVVFKGSGWYATDHRKPESASADR